MRIKDASKRNERPHDARGDHRFPLVRFETFIQAIRDSGYKGTASALAELIDNALEARAKKVHIELVTESGQDLVTAIRVSDDGEGMTPRILQTALQFGGSSRFNSRVGLGRYGMGLPCSSLSIAQRVDVWTWRRPSAVWWSYLDVHEIARKGLDAVPAPERRALSTRPDSPTGTIVALTNCDRLDCHHVSPLLRALQAELGRIFRHLLLAGAVIVINGAPVSPVDPLFLAGDTEWSKGKPYGPPLVFPIRVPGTARTSNVKLRFSELPVKQWADLPNREKRKQGIAKGAGVSIVRAGREVDYGWFFMGGKRKENYDDWWRCEVHYTPELDEVFGLTHTKQRVRPVDALEQIITPEVEAVARTLNARVRTAFLAVKTDSDLSPSERRARDADLLLNPPRSLGSPRLPESPFGAIAGRVLRGLQYDLSPQQLASTVLFEPNLRDDTLQVRLNTRHAFYEHVYENVKRQTSLKATDAVKLIDLLILAYCRAELSTPNQSAQRHAARMRTVWSEVLTSYFG